MQSRGFTLVELAVAMIIVALLLASALWPLSTQMEMRAIAETQRTMEEIRESIIGFTLANGRLPCPAIPGTPTSQTDATTSEPAGVEDTNPYPIPTSSPYQFVCRRSFGVVPWTTLGTAERDAWGRRFSYRVSPAFGDAPGTDATVTQTWATATTTSPTSPANQSSIAPCNLPTTPALPAPTLATFALCTLGDIAVFNPTIAAKTPTAATANGVPAVIISHGRNGVGAYQSNGTAVDGTTSTHEAANVSGTTTATPTGSYASYVFYTRERSPASSGCSDTAADVAFCEFDDILVWIPSSTLVARMVSAGRLP